MRRVSALRRVACAARAAISLPQARPRAQTAALAGTNRLRELKFAPLAPPAFSSRAPDRQSLPRASLACPAQFPASHLPCARLAPPESSATPSKARPTAPTAPPAATKMSRRQRSARLVPLAPLRSCLELSSRLLVWHARRASAQGGSLLQRASLASRESIRLSQRVSAPTAALAPTKARAFPRAVSRAQPGLR